MSRRRTTVAVAVAIAAALGAGAPPVAQAAGLADFAGTWVIQSSTVAPWKEPGNPLGEREDGRLVGRTVVFGAKSVTGPSPIGCAKPVYKVATVGPDMIFEGQLAEPHAHVPKPDPAGAATALGFADPQRIVTLDAGCTELQFHVVRPGTVAFGLNNRVYYMARRT